MKQWMIIIYNIQAIKSDIVFYHLYIFPQLNDVIPEKYVHSRNGEVE